MFKDDEDNYQLKIIKNESAFTSVWNNYPEDESLTVNEWMGSILQTHLTDTYYPTISTKDREMIDESAVFNINGIYLVNYSGTISSATYQHEKTYNHGASYPMTDNTIKVGLMNESDYLYAGDYDCRNLYKVGEPECNNNNWLYSGTNKWTMNTYSSYGKVAYLIWKTGYTVSHFVNAGVNARPVVYLKSNVAISSGTGTSTDPYILKLDYLTLNANGGTVTAPDGWTQNTDSTIIKDVTSLTTYGDLPEPTRENYIFLGWYTDITFKTQITSTTTITSTVSHALYAKWKPKFTAPIVNKTNVNESIERFMYDSEWNEVEENPTYTEYRYYGASPNNYVTFNGETWRIIGMFKNSNDDYQLKIMRNESIGRKQYDSDTKIAWLDSDLKEYLTDTYYPSLTSDAQGMVDTGATFNINSISYSSDLTAASEYKQEKTIDNEGFTRESNEIKVGLINLSDYAYATISSCRNALEYINNSTCVNNNWMIGICNDDIETMTTRSSYTNRYDMISYYIYSGGIQGITEYSDRVVTFYGFVGGTISTYHYIHPVVYLVSTVKITGGTGTSTDPYTLGLSHLTLNANGGTVTALEGWEQKTSSVVSKEITDLSTYGELPEPTKEGYVFAGWYTDLTFKTQITSESSLISSSSHLLYAKWDKHYTLTFDANEGSVTTLTKDVIYGNEIGELPTPTYTNYKFMGWYTSKTTGVKIIDTSIMTYNEDMTLYAHWEDTIYTVPIINKTNTSENVERFTFDSNWVQSDQFEYNCVPTYVEYRYTGASPNNYVSFNDELWRIIGIFKDSNGDYRFKIIKSKSSYYGTYWDSNGSNVWSTSSLKAYLTDTYYPSLTTDAQDMVDVDAVFNTNAIPNIYYLKSFEVYKLEKTEDNSSLGFTKENNTLKVGLMNLSDYMYASNEECRNSYSMNNYYNTVCSSNNWMIGSKEWVMNANRYNSKYTFVLYNTGYISSVTVDSSAYFTPVVYLKSSLSITGGTGTSTDPYTLG